MPGVPIVPVGQWGPQFALTPLNKVAALRVPRLMGWFRENRLPRRPKCLLMIGEPISSGLLSKPAIAVAGVGEPDLRAVTDYVMSRIGALVAEVSGICRIRRPWMPVPR